MIAPMRTHAPSSIVTGSAVVGPMRIEPGPILCPTRENQDVGCDGDALTDRHDGIEVECRRARNGRTGADHQLAVEVRIPADEIQSTHEERAGIDVEASPSIHTPADDTAEEIRQQATECASYVKA
jgi:hypothetical protein